MSWPTLRTLHSSAAACFKSHKIKSKWVPRVSVSHMTDSKLVASVTHTHTHTRAAHTHTTTHIALWCNLLLISDFGLMIDFLCVFGLNYSVVHFISSPSPLPGLSRQTLPSLTLPFVTLVNKRVKFGPWLCGTGWLVGCSCEGGGTQTDIIAQQSITVIRGGINSGLIHWGLR